VAEPAGGSSAGTSEGIGTESTATPLDEPPEGWNYDYAAVAGEGLPGYDPVSLNAPNLPMPEGYDPVEGPETERGIPPEGDEEAEASGGESGEGAGCAAASLPAVGALLLVPVLMMLRK
jgi:hypothetical protein